MGKQKRNAEDMRRAIDEFHKSGLTRREFCRRHDIAMTTLDYWRRTQSRPARLVKVKVAASEPAPGVSLTLANGRRIESGWRFAEVELVRLIRIVEGA
jgi:transposase-like protein